MCWAAQNERLAVLVRLEHGALILRRLTELERLSRGGNTARTAEGDAVPAARDGVVAGIGSADA
jgi:hypothetical protein